MPEGDWQLPVLLIAILALGVGMLYVKMRRYTDEVNRALRLRTGEHLMLISGRGRTFKGTAIVIAIADTVSRQIIHARAQTGPSFLTKFRDAPELLGPIEGALDRVHGSPVQAAAEMALAEVPPPEDSGSPGAGPADREEPRPGQ